ncbi:MAG: dihydroneopterin aldolase [Pseudomonadota bacterium]|nr:dihydroneopterin aldolase [Pseudomonadota bacterium]
MPTRRFFVEGRACACRIGAYDHERLAPQRVIIDAEILLADGSEPQSDSLDDALNYDLIRGAVLDIAESRHFDLQETLARELYDALAALPGVAAVRVRTAKPDAYEDCRQIAYELSGL